MSYTGLSPKDPNKYVGPNVYISTIVSRNREPTGADYRQPETGKIYPFGSYWLISKDPTTGVQGDLWYLSKVVSNVAYWLKLSAGGSGAVLAIEVDAITAPGVNPVTPLVGVITFHGDVVANHSVPVETRSRALNVMNLEVQYATSAAATDGTKSGLAHFNSAMFTVDASGFVSLSGGGLAIDQINVDAHTAPGTDPVVADGTGQITVTGGQVASGTIGANAIRTDSLAANTYTIEIQRAATSASSSVNNNGISSYNSTDFTIDANGYVSLIPVTSTQFANLGISYSAGTFTVCGYNGTALSASNPAIVWLQDKATPGLLKKYTVTANQTFTDGAAGTTDNMRWGLTTGVNAATDIPFYLYAVGDDTQASISFMISRIPHAATSPVAASIGKSGAVVNVGQGDFFSLASVTVADYESNPCLLLGSFRMQFVGATDSWTVQTLSITDGIGEYQDKKTFSMPRGQFGAASGKYFYDNGGTAPDISAAFYNYRIDRTGHVQMDFGGNTDTAGVGAVLLKLAVPFQQGTGFTFGSGYLTFAGGSPGSTTVTQFPPAGNFTYTVYNTYIGGIGVQGANLNNVDLQISAVYIINQSYIASQ